MQRAHPVSVRVLDDDDGRVRDVHANLDDGCRDEDLRVSVRERLERRRLFLRVHLTVQDTERDTRELLDECLVLNLGALEPLE